MILTARQLRVAANMAEGSADGRLAIDETDKRGIYPAIDVAIQAREGQHGRRDDGWKMFIVYDNGTARWRER